jgi:zinc transporter ZupT
MDYSTAISMFVSSMFGFTPNIVIYLAGIVVSVGFRRRYPRPSAYLLLAMILFLSAAVVSIFGTDYLHNSNVDMQTDWRVVLLYKAMDYLLRAVALAFIFAAIVSGRFRSQSEATL